MEEVKGVRGRELLMQDREMFVAGVRYAREKKWRSTGAAFCRVSAEALFEGRQVFAVAVKV